MSEEYIEVSAKTLDDAITEACQKLSVTSDRLDYDVIDQGSSGFLGFNARPVIIRARAKDSSDRKDAVLGDVLEKVHTEESAGKTAGGAEDPGTTAEEEENTSDDETSRETEHGSHSYAAGSRNDYTVNREKKYVAHSSSTDDFLSTGHKKSRRPHHGSYDEAPAMSCGDAESHASRHADEPKVDYTDEQIADFTKKAEDFLRAMFQAMNMEVTVTSDFDREENILTVDFEGDDMGVLIGKRGQTLDSVQYLISLVVNKGLPGYVHVKADTENYRERRRKTLENLAKNIAFKVKRTHKAVALEPMNPYERRIIHSALQGDRYVTTYSEGEDPYRKVVVAPKN